MGHLLVIFESYKNNLPKIGINTNDVMTIMFFSNTTRLPRSGSSSRKLNNSVVQIVDKKNPMLHLKKEDVISLFHIFFFYSSIESIMSSLIWKFVFH